jgi:hypothetical protein
MDCLVPGHHSSRHFSALAGNVTLCREGGDAKMMWSTESAQLYFLAIGPDAGLEFGWAYVELQNSGNARDRYFDLVASPLRKAADRTENGNQKYEDFHFGRDFTSP